MKFPRVFHPSAEAPGNGVRPRLTRASARGVHIPSGMRRGSLTRSQSTLANRASRTVRVVGSLSAAAVCGKQNASCR